MLHEQSLLYPTADKILHGEITALQGLQGEREARCRINCRQRFETRRGRAGLRLRLTS